MISVEQAQALIMQHLPEAVETTVSLEHAQGYSLARNIDADRDYPPFDRITHDGIAIAYDSYHQGRMEFRISGYAAAGQKQASLASSEACIEVATGAPLPKNCDTVVPYELLEIKDGTAALLPGTVVKKRECLHFQGSDMPAGAQLLAHGQVIGIQDIAMLAANGMAQVPVFAKPAIGILSTGDELVGPEEAVLPHQIRRSNDLALRASLNANGFSDVETRWAPDDKTAIARILALWHEQKKWIFITGGVSRGKYDYVPDVLEKLGVETLFHHVAQRPGKPLWVGFTREAVPVFGLPGNPNSSLTCLTRYGLPALRLVSGLSDEPQWRPLAQSFIPHPALTLFTPVTISADLNTVQSVKTQGSGDFIALHGTAGFVELPPADNAYAKCEKMAFYPWRNAP